MLLTVSAANLDVAASVTVNGSTIDAWRRGGLPIDYVQDHVPSTYGYPIYHYVQMLGFVEQHVALGSTLTVAVTNSDGQSDTRSYTVPSARADLDSNGDGLLDT